MRAALGAGRERIVRQLLTESLLLSTLGGAAGVALRRVCHAPAGRLVPTTLPVPNATVLDPRVLLFAALLTILTGVAFGVLPAMAHLARRKRRCAARRCRAAAFGGRERVCERARRRADRRLDRPARVAPAC